MIKDSGTTEQASTGQNWDSLNTDKDKQQSYWTVSPLVHNAKKKIDHLWRTLGYQFIFFQMHA